MFRSRAAIAAVVLATTFTAMTGTSQGATAASRIYIPWTEQTVFALAPDRSYVAEWNGPGSGWTIISGSAEAIYAGSAGVFKLDWSGNIWMYDGTPNNWTEIGGPGYQFAEGGGHLYGVAPDRSYVAEWNGTVGGGWTIIGGPVANISAGPAGLVEVSPEADKTLIYDGTPGAWTQISGSTQGAYSGNAIYGVDPTGQMLEQWTGGTSWEPILDFGTQVFSVEGNGPAGLFVYVNGATYAYNGTPYSWTQISNSPLFVAAVSRTHVYGYTNDPTHLDAANVELYSGSGTSWSVIGGPAWQTWQGGMAAGD